MKQNSFFLITKTMKKLPFSFFVFLFCWQFSIPLFAQQCYDKINADCYSNFNLPSTQIDKSNTVLLGNFIGTNMRREDPVDKFTAVGILREYHDWSFVERMNSIYPNNQSIQWNPAPFIEQESFDGFYNAIADYGLQISSVIKDRGDFYENCPDYSPYNNGWKICREQAPIFAGSDPAKSISYLRHAIFCTQFANRFCSPLESQQLSPAADKNIDSPADDYSRNKVSYIETWNEQDKWWWTWNEKDCSGYFKPEEYAAMASIAYDGYIAESNTFAKAQDGNGGEYSLGIKTISPSTKVVLGGLHKLDECYLLDMLKWFENNRQNPSIELFPFDVINFHHYSNSLGDAGAGIGISPEKDGLRDKLKKFDLIRDNYPGLQDKELWISEFGYGTIPSKFPTYSASPITNPSTGQTIDEFEVQGQWLVRSFLEIAAADFDKAFQFCIRDAPSPGFWDQATGLIDSTYSKKKSWYYVHTLKSVLGDLDFETDLSPQCSSDELSCSTDCPRVYKFSEPSNPDNVVYAVWSPTDCNKPTYNYNLDIGNETTAISVALENHFAQGLVNNITVTQGNVTVPVSESPTFIIPNKAPKNIPCPDDLKVSNASCNTLQVKWKNDPKLSHYTVLYGKVSDIQSPTNPDLKQLNALDYDLASTHNYVTIYDQSLQANIPHYIYVIGIDSLGRKSNFCPISLQTNSEECKIDMPSVASFVDENNNPNIEILKLFDQQSGNTCNFNQIALDENTHWKPYNANRNVVATFDTAHAIDAIHVLDAQGIGKFSIFYQTDNSAIWKPFIDRLYTKDYGKWISFTNVIDQYQTPITKLMIKTEGTENISIQEVIICGRKVVCNYPDAIDHTVLSGNVARINWNIASDAERYRIRYRTIGGNWIEKLTAGTETFRWLNGLSPSTKYEYQVKSLCVFGNSAWSPSFSFTTNTELCDFPEEEATKQILNSSTIKLSWTKRPDEIKYKFRYRSAQNQPWVDHWINAPEIRLSLLNPTLNYSYKIKSKCNGGWTNWGEEYKFSTSDESFSER